MTKHFAFASTITGASASYAPLRNWNTGLTVNIGIKLSSTGSVQPQGSFDNGTNWFSLGAAITATGVSTIAMCPLMRFNVTANAGTADCWLME